MKKEASGKKGKWLWLVLGIVALLAVVSVVLVLVLGGQGDKDAAGGRAELYWNVDKDANTDRDTGLSIRQPAEDGNFYVRFAHDGEQVEIPVADKKLVNYIDSLSLMNLVLDNNGYVVDVKPVTDVASVIGESLYVQSVNGNTVVANSSIMMNGRKVTIELNEEAGIYNVSGKGEFVGEAIDPSKLNPMDTISAYGTLVPEDFEEDPVLTHIFVTKKPAESAVYWRAEQFYNSSLKETTREPDENGVYTIDFWVDGEYVSLKCKDKAVVTFIDAPAYYWCHFGLEFDEEGYIIEALDSFLASRTLLQCERYDITEIYDDGSYVATSLIKNNGAFVQGTVGADCPIWEVSKASKAEGEPCRKIDSLKLGDRVCIWTDTNGTPVLIYVAHRLVDSPAYFNVTRSYDSTALTTSREPVNGYYEIEMVEAGKTGTKVYRTKDIELATAIDKTSDLCVGLKLAEDGKTIQYVYDMECVFGYTYFCRGYFIQDVTGSVATYLSPSYSGASKNGVLAAGAKVWNVSGHGTMGEETTLQYGDTVYACKTPIGEVANAYVTRRVLGINTAYWNITRKWDATNKTTTRVPDEEGYYVFEMAHNGKVVEVKTKDIKLANKIDSQNTHRYFSLLVNSKGIITEVNSAYFCLGGSRYASHYVIAVDGNKITTLNSSKTKQYEIILDDKCQIFNVSTAYKNNLGERTKLQVGDYITLYRDVDPAGSVLLGWVRSREVSKMAWPVDPQYDSTNACTKRVAVDGWYYIPLAIDGEVKTYKTKSKDVASGVDSYTSAFGVEIKGDEIVGYTSSAYVKNVKGTGLTNYVVSKDVTGSKVNVVYTLGSADKTGKTESFTMSSKCKVYDVSPTAEKFGAPVKLKEGDTIRTYVDDDENVLFVYVISHCTREGGYKSLCDHCGEVVFWNAYSTSANAVAYDCHYYLPADLNVTSQIRVYNTERDYEIVLDLNGHTICRDGGRMALVRYGDTFTIFDSSKDGKGTIKSRNNTSNGGVIMVSTDGILNLGAEKIEKKGNEKVKTGEYLFGGNITMDSDVQIVRDEKTNEILDVTFGDKVTAYADGSALITNSSIINMYDANITGGVAVSREDGATGGGVVSSGTFNMYGGDITNCIAIGWHIDENGEKKAYTGSGGNVYVGGGNFNMFGGTIANGLASRGGNVTVAGGTFTMTGGVIANGVASRELGKSTDARGGNIFSTGNVYLKGGEVYGGVTDGNSYGGNLMSTGLKDCIYISGDAHIFGGTAIKYTTNEDGTKTPNESLSNIYLMYSNLVVEGGTVDMGDWTSGSVIGSTGTNTGGYSTVTVAGGTVKGNISLGGSTTTILKDEAGQTYYVSGDDKINVYFREDGTAYTLSSKNKEVAFYPDYRTELTLTGGKVEGTVNASATRKITVSGNPVVDLLKAGSNLLNVGVMTEGASVTIDKVGVFTPALDKAAVEAAVKGQFIKATNKDLILGATDANELKIYHPDAVAAYCEHCDSIADWIPTSVLPTGSGHYILKDNVIVTEEATIDTGTETILDLAGHVVSAATETVVDADGNETVQGTTRIFYVKGDLSILDTSEVKTGMIADGRGTRGGNFYVSSGTLTVYGGTIAYGVADNTLGTTSTNGRGGNIFSTGKVILKGGAVVDGKALNGSGYGGNICVTGLSAGVTIEGDAVVSGGDAKAGDNIYTMYSNLTVSGGTIVDGGVYTSGTNTGGFSTVTISGGSFQGGTLEFSGNVTEVKDGEEAPPYADYRTALTISGGKFNCTINARVQNFNISGKPVITALKLYEGSLMILGALEEGAKIALTEAGIFTTPMESKEVAESYIKYFVTKGESYLIEVTADFALNHTQDMGDVTKQKFFCAHCNQEVEFVSWNGGIFESVDHYYLTGDLKLDDAVTIANKRDVVIELNGYTVTAAESTRAFYLNGALHVQDSSEAKTGVITGGTATRGGNIYLNGGKFYLYSGTVAGGVADNDLGSGTTNGRGGNIFAAAGEIHLKGGAVVDGRTNNGSGYGGNICVTGLKSYLYISGDAVISGGNSKSGGNVYLMYANMVMEGGTITGGTTSGTGENICTSGTATGGRSSVTISAGTISDGTVALAGSISSNTEDAYHDYRTVVNVSGGVLDCEFTASAYEFKLSGAPVFTNLALSGTSVITVGELSEGASVALNETSGAFTTAFASKEAAEAAAKYFAVASGYEIAVTGENALEVKAEQAQVTTKQFVCQRCGTTVDFTSWNGSEITASGHYYLDKDVTLTEAIRLKDGVDVVIELNGHKITANGCRAFYVNGGTPTLSIQDSVGTGEIYGGNSNGGRGGNVYASGGNVHIYGGKIYGGTAATGNSSGNDVAVYNGEFTVSGNAQIGQAYETGYAVFLFSCTKIDATDATITGGLLLRSLTNFDLRSSLTVDHIGLWSSKIQSVEARTGDKITVKTTDSNTVAGYGVFTAALENAAAAVEYFQGVEGFEIVANDDGTLEIVKQTSTEPSDPTEPSEPSSESCPHCAGAEWKAWDGTTTASGHYYLTADVQLSEMLIITSSSDTVIDLRGFTITAAENLQTFRVNGTFSVVDTSEAQTGKITGGVALPNSSTLLCRGGNICINGGDFYLYSGSIVDGVADNRGGNIYVTGQGSVNILGGTVSGGSVSKSGGANIFVNYSTLNISGGQIISEEANTQPNVSATGYNEKNCVLNISGGEIKGSKIGLDMYSNLSEVTISGGTIEGQTIISAKGAKFAISGKPVIADLALSNDAVISEIGTMEAGASVKVNATSGKFTAELADAAAVAGYFDAVDAAYNVAADAENKYLEIVEDPNGGETTEPTTEATEPSTEPSTEATEPGANLESCPHCDGAEWVALDLSAVTDDTLTAGHYYVPAGGIQLTARLAIKAGEEIVIDLRGETITAAEATRAFYVYGKLAVVDTSAEQTGKIVGATVTENGGTIYVTTDATLDLYSGTITGGAAPRGGNIFVSKGTINMYGGAVVNGVADNALGTTTTNGRGGNIFSSGNVNLYGGTVSGGKTVGGSSFGGNIMSTGLNYVVTISNTAVVSGGEAATGSSVYLMYSKLVMTGGEIADGGVYLHGTDSSGYSSLDISGGVIAAVETKMIDELKVSGTAVIKSLKLAEGHLVTVGALTEGASIVLSNESGVFTAAFADATAAEAVKAYFDTVAHDKTVVVNAENALEIVEGCSCGCKAPASTIEWKDANAYIAEMAAAAKDTIDESVHLKLSADMDLGAIYNATGKQIVIGKNAACDVTIDLNGFTWSTKNTRAIYNYANTTLTIMDSSEAKTGKIVSTGRNNNAGGVLAVYGNFNLRGGSIVLENPVALQSGGVVYMNATGYVFNMYGGTITGGSIASTDTKSANGGNVYIYNGTFNMYGGEILNGKAVGTAEYPGFGGNLAVRPTAVANLYGGTISGGAADIGADINLMVNADAGATLNISGTNVAGEVYVPSAMATVTVSGTAVIGELELVEDAIVTVGELTEGASIAVNKATEFTGALEDPDSVKDFFTGMDANSGVKVTAENKLIITTGCVCGCGTPSDEVVWEDAAAYLAAMQATDNGVISESVHLKLSADLDITALYGKNKQISLNPGEGTSKVTIDLNGYTWSSNHRLYVYAGAELTIMDSSEAKTGTMTSTGNIASGRVIINYGTINLLSGTLTMTEEGAVYVKAGGVVYQSSGTFNMYGGAIINGKVEDKDSTIGAGGNVNIRTGEFNIYGGTISGGVGTNGYNIYVGASAKLNIYNDSVVVGNEGDDTLGIYKA